MFAAAGLKRTCPTFLGPVRWGVVVVWGDGIPRMASQFADWADVFRLLTILMEGKALRYLPYENLAIVGARGDNAIVERVPGRELACGLLGAPSKTQVPICIQHRRSVSSKQRDLFRKPTLFVQRYNSKGTTTAGFPIDREVFGVCLDSQSALRQTPGRLPTLTFTRFVSHALRLMCKLS